jgi:hypothetical protein
MIGEMAWNVAKTLIFHFVNISFGNSSGPEGFEKSKKLLDSLYHNVTGIAPMMPIIMISRDYNRKGNELD